MKKPVCVECLLFFRVKRNNVAIEEGRPTGDTWAAYKLWIGDLWECRGCGAQILIGALHPVAEHYQPDYAEKRAQLRPLGRVDDC